MILSCGPDHDQRILNFELPRLPNFSSEFLKKLYLRTNGVQEGNNIGVLVSGGLDSALMYYLLLEENKNTGNKFKITPYSMMRKEGSRFYAIQVIEYINSLFKIETTGLNIVGDNTLEEIKQVESAIKEVFSKNENFIYVGIIEARPEHSINWVRHKFKETVVRKYPLLNLEKSHIIDLIIKLNLNHLFSITHSCAVNEKIPCGNCNGCNERAWGFEQLGLIPA